MIDAVAFDLDGTLIESERVWEGARRSLAESSGGHWHEDAQPQMMGLSTPEWIAYMQNRLDVPLEAEQIRRAVTERIADSYRQNLPLIEGAVDAVRSLAGRRPLALASSSPRSLIELALDLSGLADDFGVVISSEEVDRGKPAPDVYLRACELLGSEPARTAAIEDSGAGVRAGLAAGMPVVMIPGSEFPSEKSALDSADVVLDSIAELVPEALTGLGG